MGNTRRPPWSLNETSTPLPFLTCLSFFLLPFHSPIPFLPVSFPLPLSLMSSHADQIHAETAFCSCGQFSLYGPDKSRHCTITGHKSLSVPCCVELLNYWTGGKSAHLDTHTLANIHIDTYLGARSPCYRIHLRITKLLRVMWEQAGHDGTTICDVYKNWIGQTKNRFRWIYFFYVYLTLDTVFTVALKRTFSIAFLNKIKCTTPVYTNIRWIPTPHTPYNQ